MTQIIFRATTATTCVAGGVITTGNVQLLPSWAPPIQYVGTTDPWHAVYLAGTTIAGNCAWDTSKKILQGKVRAYGRRSTLHSGRECFAANRAVDNQYGSVRPMAFYVFTYRAIGEIARP